MMLNDAQRIFVHEVFDQIRAGKPVQIIILKAIALMIEPKTKLING